VVWESDEGEPIGFQFCYGKGCQEHALGWTAKHGYSHMAVDDGESGGALRYKATPVLLAVERVSKEGIAELFAHNSRNLPKDIAAFVSRKIAEYVTMKSNE
jgi:hypothetical protein